MNDVSNGRVGASSAGGVLDADLLARGDDDSFAEFYARHARRLAGYLMRATGDAEVAADLTAETFAAALAARGRYRPSAPRRRPGCTGSPRHEDVRASSSTSAVS
jgi:hypothetical protein